MGFHSFLQAQNVPFESAMAKSWNMRIFKSLRRGADAASVKVAEERGPCWGAAELCVDRICCRGTTPREVASYLVHALVASRS